LANDFKEIEKSLAGIKNSNRLRINISKYFDLSPLPENAGNFR